MLSMLPTDFFVKNRRKLMSQLSSVGPVVLTANGLMQRGADSPFPFAQDANFWYLTGLNQPDLVLVINRDEEFIIAPTRDAGREAFDGTIDFHELTSRSGIENVYKEDDGWRRLLKLLNETGRYASVSPPPAYLERQGLYTNPAREHLKSRLQAKNPDINAEDIGSILIHMRMLKQPAEIAMLEQAITVTIEGLRQVTDPAKLAAYKYEYELEADLTAAFRGRGASGHSFEPIVAGGKRACVLHNVANNGRLNKNELIVIDVGAEWEHYAADITRTVCKGVPAGRQKEIHLAVQTAQSYAVGILRPGMTLKEFESQVERKLGESLQALGLIKEANRQSIRRYSPHAASHHLGLNVHDPADYDRPLEAGNVITVEPGIYVPAEGIGVRIEDDVLITKSGCRILSDGLPRHL